MTEQHPVPRRSATPTEHTGLPAYREDSPGVWGDDRRPELRRYTDILARRWRFMAVTFVLVAGAVVAGTFLQEPVYRATGLLEIRQPSASQSPTDALASPERISSTALATERGLLESPALARRVVMELELHRHEGFHDSERGNAASPTANPGAAPLSGRPDEREIQTAVEEFLENLTIHPTPESRLVEVSFDAPDPELAAHIVNATLESHGALRMETAQRAMGWMEGQLDSLRAEVARSEDSLRAYADEHGLPYVVEEDLSPRLRERVHRLQDELADAESRRYETESVYDQVVRGEDHEATGDPVMEDLSSRRAELQQEYANLSAVFTDDYPGVQRVLRQLEEVDSLMAQERRRIARDAESRHRLAQRQEEAVREALTEEQAAADALVGQSGSYHLLRSEVLANRELYASLQENRGEVNVSAALEATGIGVVNEAAPPLSPHRPVLLYNLALALMAGLVLGVGGGFLREMLDDTVHTGQELGSRPDAPLLAMIPAIERPRRARGTPALPPATPRIAGPDGNRGATDRQDMLNEALGILRTAVLFRGRGEVPRSIAVSSCQPEEGKTTVGLNLALSLARLDRKVLLVDADLRRSGLTRGAALDEAPGLVDILRTGGDWRKRVTEDPRDARLSLLPSGGTVQDAGELLSHARLQQLLREAEEDFELVILDAPPLFINVPDARILAEVVSGVLVVARSERTSSTVLGQVLETTPNVLGVVLNDLQVNRLPPQYRRFFHAYPADPEAHERRGTSAGGTPP